MKKRRINDEMIESSNSIVDSDGRTDGHMANVSTKQPNCHRFTILNIKTTTSLPFDCYNHPFLLCLLLFSFNIQLIHSSIIQEDANLTFVPTVAPSNLNLPQAPSSAGNNSSHHHHNNAHHHHHHHPHNRTTSSSSLTVSTSTADYDELPLLPPLVPSSSLSSSSGSNTFDQTIHPDKNNPKGLRFEEEPADSYIVRSKSAMLRCRTLNALNAWFTCNSGDERRIQSQQKISNYVDPQTGIRLIEIDLEITRSDVEEHQNSGYTNPFQCWCTAYGGHHQIMSRKASVSFAFLKKHFHLEPKSLTISLVDSATKSIEFKCRPPAGVPEPVVFWMRNDVIILESEPSTKKDSPTSHPMKSPGKFFRAKKNHLKPNPKRNKPVLSVSNNRTRRNTPNNSTNAKKDGEEEDEDDDEDEDYDDEDEDLEFDASKQPEKEIGSDDDEDDEDGQGDLLLPHHFDLASGVHGGLDKDKKFINYHMADDYTLVIKHLTMDDQANYTCGVYNVAGVRFTRPAILSVFVNGEWSEWGEYSPCQLAPGLTTQGMKCGIGTQKRVRHCNNPAPVNNGQFCPGESVQVQECTILCPAIDGFWSPWTQWSSCSHECTSVRRRICNNPVPQYGGHDCFGPDIMVKNCTGGLCRKLFDSTIFIGQQTPPGGSVHHHLSTNNDQLYFIIIFILILIILTFVIYIMLKFQLHRRRHGVKTFSSGGHSSWWTATSPPTGGVTVAMTGGDSDHLSHGSCVSHMDPMDETTSGGRTLTPTLLLLQQQHDGRFYNKPIKGCSPHPHFPLEQLKSNSTPATGSGTASKFQLVSRLNGQHQTNQLEHFLMASSSNSPAHMTPKHSAPLPSLPRDSDGDNASMLSASTSGTTGTSNRYEEPQFRSPLLPVAAHKSPLIVHQNNNQQQSMKKKTTPGVTTNSTNSGGSANTTSTTTANEFSNSSSEPDYAEPIINDDGLEEQTNVRHPPPTQPVPPLPTLLPPPSSLIVQQQQRFPQENNSSTSSNTDSADNSAMVQAVCGRHEKYLKITDEIVRYGHFSSMSNLGVALYLPPGFFSNNRKGLVGAGAELYLRYGLDTRTRLPGVCSLSSVITLQMSNRGGGGGPGHHSDDSKNGQLQRPVILCFRHCLLLNDQQQSSPSQSTSLKNIVILWQPEGGHLQKSSTSKWIELIRLSSNGDNHQMELIAPGHNEPSFAQIDSCNVYLMTRSFGRYLLCYKQTNTIHSDSLPSPTIVWSNHTGSMSRTTKEQINTNSVSWSKLVNFAMTIEPTANQQKNFILKCFVYDNLPSSVLMFHNDHCCSSLQSPSNGQSNQPMQTMIGRMSPLTNTAYNSSLRLNATKQNSSLCFELQTPQSNGTTGSSGRLPIKGQRRMEIPIDQLCSLGPNSILHCTFTVSSPPGSNSFECEDNEMIVDTSESSSDDDNGDQNSDSSEEYFEDDNDQDEESSPTYENQQQTSLNSLNLLKQKRRRHFRHKLKKNDKNHLNNINYDIKVWQQIDSMTTGAAVARSKRHSPFIILNRMNMTKHKGGSSGGNQRWQQYFYHEECCPRLFADGELQLRTAICERLDQSGAWRQWALIGSNQPSIGQIYPSIFIMAPLIRSSPSQLLMELCETKIINELISIVEGSTSNGRQTKHSNKQRSMIAINPMKMKELFYAKLLHQFQSIRRTDLVEMILGHQF